MLEGLRPKTAEEFAETDEALKAAGIEPSKVIDVVDPNITPEVKKPESGYYERDPAVQAAREEELINNAKELDFEYPFVVKEDENNTPKS